MQKALDYESREQKKSGTPCQERSHPVLLLAASLLAAWLPTLVLGVGTPPCFLFLGAILVAIIGNRLSYVFHWPYRVEVAAVGIIFVLSAVTSFCTTRPSPNHMFLTAFGVTPPAGVKNITGRAQWFDGLTIVMRFDADGLALDQILKHRQFAQEPARASQTPGVDVNHVRSKFIMSRLVDPNWDKTITGSSGELWEWVGSGVAGSYEGTKLFVNEKGEVWAIYNSQ